MAVSAQFNDFVLDLLSAVCAVSARRMFGGVGYYADGFFFAIADDDILYFRVDASSRVHFEAEGMPAFAPLGPGTKSMSYFSVPARLYDDAEELAVWMRRALAAARAGRPSPRGRGRRAPGSTRSRRGA
jgi:DNA transformation protein and related proteins